VEPEVAGSPSKEPVLETTPLPNTQVVEKAQIVEVETAPIPSNEELIAPLLERVHVILRLNDFSERFEQVLMEMMSAELIGLLPVFPSDQEFELMLVDKIVSLVEIDHKSQLHPLRVFILLGPTGIGKTTTIAKIAALYGLQQVEEYRRKVRIITIDSFRTGAFEQISAFGAALGIPVAKAATENEFFHLLQESDGADLILVDTIGKSPRDLELALRMKTLLSVPKREETGFYLALSGSMKAQDMHNTLDQYSSYGIRSLVVTKTDETESVGTILSLCHERHLPLLFLTDGQKVPKDIHKASASSLLTMLKGFSLDFSNLWPSQIDIDGEAAL
jgi:flagellar biosynthesis protein FlhF